MVARIRVSAPKRWDVAVMGGGVPMATVPPFVLSQIRATISKRWHVDRMREMVGRIFDSSEKVARRRDGRHNRSNGGTYP